MTRRLLAAAVACVVAAAAPASAHDIVRRGGPTFPISTSVSVPAGSELVFLSGTLADVADTSAPANSIERFGDTATQTKSVLGKIAKELDAVGPRHGRRREDERVPRRRPAQGRCHGLRGPDARLSAALRHSRAEESAAHQCRSRDCRCRARLSRSKWWRPTPPTTDLDPHAPRPRYGRSPGGR
jgi:hypothetical protein